MPGEESVNTPPEDNLIERLKNFLPLLQAANDSLKVQEKSYGGEIVITPEPARDVLSSALPKNAPSANLIEVLSEDTLSGGKDSRSAARFADDSAVSWAADEVTSGNSGTEDTDSDSSDEIDTVEGVIDDVAELCETPAVEMTVTLGVMDVDPASEFSQKDAKSLAAQGVVLVEHEFPKFLD